MKFPHGHQRCWKEREAWRDENDGNGVFGIRTGDSQFVPGIRGGRQYARDLYVISFFADLFKPRGFKAALDLAKSKRLKPPQPLCQSGGLSEAELPAEVRSAIQAPREDLVRASSSVLPWLATSTSRHCETNQSPSRQTASFRSCGKAEHACCEHVRDQLHNRRLAARL